MKELSPEFSSETWQTNFWLPNELELGEYVLQKDVSCLEGNNPDFFGGKRITITKGEYVMILASRWRVQAPPINIVFYKIKYKDKEYCIVLPYYRNIFDYIEKVSNSEKVHQILQGAWSHTSERWI